MREEEQVSEEEIRMMVDAGSEKGTIAHQEKEFIQNVFEFNDIMVESIATHRTDVTILWLEDDMDSGRKLFITAAILAIRYVTDHRIM